MRVLVTGGCGYIGSVLVPKLVAAEHAVSVIDLEWFGNHINGCGADFHAGDFRTLSGEELSGFDAIIHLAAVANDPTGDLDRAMTWEINALGTQRLADMASRALVKQFIYASSGSVYGVSGAPQVTEDTELNPLTAYNETKMVAERCLLSYSSSMQVQIIRPATVCGVSPRQRLDVVVNMLAMQALTTGRIELMSPEAMRPHITIEDMTDLYLWMLDRPQLAGIWNAGFENYSVLTVARKVRHAFGASIEIMKSNDPRSYRMCSDKLLSAGFAPQHSVAGSIKRIAMAYRAGEIKDEDQCHNIRTMRRLQIA